MLSKTINNFQFLNKNCSIVTTDMNTLNIILKKNKTLYFACYGLNNFSLLLIFHLSIT